MATVTQVRNLIKTLYHSSEKVSLILLGPPGVGKTVVVEEAAKELAVGLGREFVDWREVSSQKMSEVMANPEEYFVFVSFSATHVEPVDLSGIPRVNSEYAKYHLLDFQHILTLPGMAGILFLDEFTTDPRADRRSSELKIINERTAGFRRFSDGVMVIAAGNTRKWSTLAEELDEPMRRGRALIVFVTPPSLDEWRDWMDETYGAEWDRRVLAFLRLYQDKFFATTNTDRDDAGDIEAGYRPLNSPRNWTKLARLLWQFQKAGVDGDLLTIAVGGLVDSETAVGFHSFLETVVPSWRELREWPKQLSVEARYLLLCQMASEDLSEEIFESKMEVLMGLDNESCALLLFLMNDAKRARFLSIAMRRYPAIFSKFKILLNDLKVAKI